MIPIEERVGNQTGSELTDKKIAIGTKSENTNKGIMTYAEVVRQNKDEEEKKPKDMSKR